MIINVTLEKKHQFQITTASTSLRLTILFSGITQSQARITKENV